jgi:GntR family transcriptional regulator, colanic acid and biofilm gene transcriptional regulator
MGPILRAFYEKSDRSYNQGHDHHEALLKALSANNPAAAVKAIRDDLMAAAPSIERFLLEFDASEAQLAA